MKKQHLFRCCFGGGRWIRTTEGIASRFTVCPLWPLGNSPIFSCAGAGGRTRTPDLLITNQLLYRLSYTSILTGTALSFYAAPERLVIIAKHTYFVKNIFQEKTKFLLSVIFVPIIALLHELWYIL